MPSPVETKPAATQSMPSTISPLAGKPAPREMLVDLARLEKEYFQRKPDVEDPNLNAIVSEAQQIVSNALSQS